ncbi:cobalamin-dependent protein [Natronospora cellulosivora (SeqCode)]
MCDFASRLKKLRKEKKLRQKDLAEELDLAQTTIANYEKNTRFPNQETLIQIAEFFDVSLDYLLGRSKKPSFIKEILEFSKEENYKDINPIAEKYLEVLLSAKKDNTYQFIEKILSEGANIESIYQDIFEPALKKIGYLWETNQINVADEHIFSNIITEHMAILRKEFAKKTDDNKPTILALAVSGEQHNIGLMMVRDMFELNGWNTYYLGTNTPASSVIKAIKEYRPKIIALSITMDFFLDTAKNLINTIRNDNECNKVKIMVGGAPFSKHSWKEIGADGYAKNAGEAVDLANKLLAE